MFKSCTISTQNTASMYRRSNKRDRLPVTASILKRFAKRMIQDSIRKESNSAFYIVLFVSPTRPSATF